MNLLSSTRQKGPRSFAAQNQYRAQWIYYTPKGYRDEPFDVPFTFNVAEDGNQHNNFPIQLDDDAPFIVRGFFQNGAGTAAVPSVLGLGFARLWDANSPPNGLSAGFAYNFGGWGFGPFSWPIEPEVYCEAGSVLMIDFQLQSTANPTPIIQGCFMGIKRRPEC
jgi:hypothetical protein